MTTGGTRGRGARRPAPLIALLTVLALVVVSSLVATAVHSASGGHQVVAFVAADGTPLPATPTPTPTATPTPLPSPTPVRLASPDGLKLWADGDSVSYFLTTNLFAMLAARGAIPVRAADYKISSRLTAATGSSAILGLPFTDWFSAVQSEMALYDPDIVVFMIGANDAGFVDPADYEAAAGRMMDLMRRPGRVVAWVGLPAFGRADLAAAAPALNAAARDAAATRNWVTFVDVSMIAADGADGVHFSPTQAQLLAQAVIDALFPGDGS
jgi:lysophospholipase L1-like esterase